MSLAKQTLGVGLSLLLCSCEAPRDVNRDLSRLVNSDSRARTKPVATAAKPAPAPSKTAASVEPSVVPVPEGTAAAAGMPAPGTVTLVGKSGDDLRALLGPPDSVQERAPGKIWQYRDGQCTVDFQLYPDVQTKRFGILAYEVKSDDNTDEGKRGCMAQLQSRAQGKGG